MDKTVNSLAELDQFLEQQDDTAILALGDINSNDLESFLHAKNPNRVSKVGLEISSDLLVVRQVRGGHRAKRMVGERAAQIVEISLRDAFKRRMPFLSELEQANYRDDLMKALSVGELYVQEDGEGPVMMLLIRDFQHENETKTLVSWVWSKRPGGVGRADLLNEVSALLKNLGREKVVAAVHRENLPSFYFFKDLGFQPICLFLK